MSLPAPTTPALPSFEARCREVMTLALKDVAGAARQATRLLDEAAGHPEHRAWALVALSHSRSYAGEFAEAITLLHDAEAICLPHQAPVVANAAVQPLLRMGRAADALAAARRAVAAAVTLRDPIAEAKALVSLGATLRAMGDAAAAEQTLAQAERLAGPQRHVAAAAASNRAECLLDQDRFNDAIACFTRAAAEFEAASAVHAAAIVRGNLADVLGRLGRTDEAVPAFEAARRTFEAAGANLDAARLLCEEAEMLAQAGAFRAARDRYATAMPVLQAGLASQDLARARVAFGCTLLELGDLAGAAKQFELASASDAPPLLAAEIILGRARCRLAEGDATEAAALADRAALAFEAIPARRVRALTVLARASLAARDHARAQRAARHALEIALDVPLPPLVPKCRWITAECAAAVGDHALAARTLNTCAAEAEALLDRTYSAAAHAGLAHELRRVFQAHATGLLDQGHPHAPDAVLRAAARTAPAAVAPVAPVTSDPAPADARTPNDPALLARLERVSQAIARAAVHAGAFGAQHHRADLADLHAQHQVLRERLSDPVRRRADAIDALSILQRRLPADAAALHIFEEAGDLSLLAVTPQDHVIRRRATAITQAHAAVRRLAFLAERPASHAPRQNRDAQDRDAWNRLLHDLAVRLLRPLEGLFRDAPLPRTLYISGHPAAQRLPWSACLRAAFPHAAPHAVCTGPAPSPAHRSPPQCRRVAVLAAGHDSIPAAAAEARAVAQHWPDATLLIDAAPEPSLNALAHADLVHIATHGVFEPERPAASRLLLGRDWVPLARLAAAIRPGAVVVLSACHAGRSGGRAEDAAAAPSVLLAAGAAAVVAPIWPIEDTAAAGFFDVFHAALRTHWPAGPAHALAAAHAAHQDSPDLAGVLTFGGLP